MIFFYMNCLAELRARDERRPRCGVSQSLDLSDRVTKLRVALFHPLVETRRRAIFLLGEKRVVEAPEELIQVIDCKTDPFLAEEAVVRLSKVGQAKALSALLRAARHKSFLVRARSIEALVAAGGAWKRTAVDLADHDSSANVRESASIDRE